MHLDPHILASTYEALRHCPPFSRWKLPEAEVVEFKVTRHRDREGDYTRYIGTDHHIIRVSSACVAHFASLAAVMAHEMIHLHQGVAKLETPGTQHNADFRTRARRVCRELGFDPKTFG